MRILGRQPTYAPHFFSDPLFPNLFAAFLRQHPDLWRTRRVDHFEPLTLTLAEHRVTLQGRIGTSLLERFFETNRVPGIRDPRVVSGDNLMLFVPVTREPKRLLLDFSVTHGDGASAALLTRYESSFIESLALLSLVRKDQGRLTDEQRTALYLVLTALVFLNPPVLVDRLVKWSTDHGKSFKRSRPTPLENHELKDWIEAEGEYFAEGLGERLRCALLDRIDRAMKSRMIISEAHRRHVDGLAYFSSIPSLLLHGIRDLLKITMEFAPAWVEDGGRATAVTRTDFASDPRLFVNYLERYVFPGLDVLETLMAGRMRSKAGGELTQDLGSWWGYAEMTISIGAPFILKTKEVLPVPPRRLKWGHSPARMVERWWRSSRGTFHLYPLALKDAASVHVEVRIPNHDLRVAGPQDDPSAAGKGRWLLRWMHTRVRKLLRRGLKFPADISLARVFGDRIKPEPMQHAFSAIARPSERLVHLYSSRRLTEAAESDRLAPYLKLYVPLQVARQVVVGYWAVTVAYFVAAAFITVHFYWFAVTEEKLSLFPQAITTAVIMTPLALWMTQVHHRDTIVNEKLALFRNGLVIMILGVFSAAAAALVRGVIDLAADDGAQHGFGLDRMVQVLEGILRAIGGN